jgi:hypothetical protein
MIAGENGGIILKKLLIGLFVLILFGVVGSVAILYYIRPDVTLTLEHQPVPVNQRVLDMVRRTSLELVLTEEDVNNILKESLARNPQRSKDVEVRGAQFRLSGNLLVADYHLKFKQRVSTALHVTYRLAWNDPDITATVTDVKLKDISLPAYMVEDLSLPIGKQLPKPLKIKDVQFGDKKLKILFQRPSLKELRDLIG